MERAVLRNIINLSIKEAMVTRKVFTIVTIDVYFSVVAQSQFWFVHCIVEIIRHINHSV